MPINIGMPELIILFFIVLLVFGGGRIAGIGRDLGKGIRELREGLSQNTDQDKTASNTTNN